MRIVCDIDGTLIYSVLRNGSYFVTDHNYSLVASLNNSYDSGDEIILHTGRHWNHLKLTIDQLEEIGIKYHSLVMGKPVGDVYIDDKAVRPDEFLAG